MLPMTLRQMEVFTAVVRHGSTVAAAGALGLSQSATSAALALIRNEQIRIQTC